MFSKVLFGIGVVWTMGAGFAHVNTDDRTEMANNGLIWVGAYLGALTIYALWKFYTSNRRGEGR